MREFITPEDFERDAESATEFDRTTERLKKEANKTLIDEYQLRRNRDWGALNSQVVGAEIDYNIE